MNKLLVFRAFAPKLREEFPQITNEMVLQADTLGKHYTWLRPGTHQFLDKLFAKYQVAVWSSAMPQNVALLCHYVFGPKRDQLVFEWSQEQCDVVDPHPDPTEKKPLFTKPLAKVVEAFSHLPQQHYKMEEILMIDDSLLKMADNPKGSYLLTKEWTLVDKEEETLEEVWRRI